MKAERFSAWVELAKEKGASRVVVHRARKNGGNTGLFDDVEVKALDVVELLARMREDVAEARRLNTAVFALEALAKDGTTVMAERLTITRDDDEESIAREEPQVAAARIYLSETRAAFTEMRATTRDARDMMTAANDCLRQALSDVAKQNADFQSKIGETLGTLFEIAQMQKEREEVAARAKERSEMMAHALREGLPILGSVIAKASKKTGPAFMTFFKSLSEQQFAGIMGQLTAEQAGNLSTLVTLIQQEQKGEGA